MDFDWFELFKKQLWGVLRSAELDDGVYISLGQQSPLLPSLYRTICVCFKNTNFPLLFSKVSLLHKS